MMLALALLLAPSMSPAASCPPGAPTQVAAFALNGTSWVACESLRRVNDAALALVPSVGATQWFAQGYQPFTQGDDGDLPTTQYYLNLSKAKVMSSKADALAVKLLSANYSHLTYELVKSAVPPYVHTQPCSSL